MPVDAPPARRGHAEIRAAPVSAELRAVAHRLPPALRLGTSSWSFPGWAGIVYEDAAGTARLARHGLAAYARHPLLRAVGIDRTFYAPVPAETLAAYAAAVPDDFRFLVKAHEDCTLARFNGQERYGARRGQRNEVFLHPAYASEMVVGRVIDGLGHKAGPILFQFPPQDAAALGGAERFAERLHTFLDGLPRGPLYAVELRNRELLSTTYATALADVGAVHCLNVHPSMPDVGDQARVAAAGDSPALVVRWMLARRYGYEEAKARYQPFDRIVDDDPAARRAIADLCRAAVARQRPAFVIINNKAEGSAPLSVFRLAQQIVTGDE